MSDDEKPVDRFGISVRLFLGYGKGDLAMKDDGKPPLPRNENGYLIVPKGEVWVIWGDDGPERGEPAFATEAEAAARARQLRSI